MRFILLCVGTILATANQQVAQSLKHHYGLDSETQFYSPGERIWVGHGIGYLTVLLHHPELQAKGELVETGVQPEIFTTDDGRTWYGFPEMPPVDYMENAIVATSLDGRIWIGVKEELNLTVEDLDKTFPADADVDYPPKFQSDHAHMQEKGLWWGYPGGTMKNPTIKSSEPNPPGQEKGLWWGYPEGTMKNPTIKSSEPDPPGQEKGLWWGYPGGTMKNPTIKSSEPNPPGQEKGLWWGYPEGTMKNPTKPKSVGLENPYAPREVDSADLEPAGDAKSLGQARLPVEIQNFEKAESDLEVRLQSLLAKESRLPWRYPPGAVKNPSGLDAEGPAAQPQKESRLWWGYPGGTMKNPNTKAVAPSPRDELAERYEELKQHMELMGYAQSPETSADDNFNGIAQELQAVEKAHMEELQRAGESSKGPAASTKKIPKPTLVIPTPSMEVPKDGPNESASEINKRFQELKAKFDELLKSKN
eukprot:Protomagalhaensia_sp_Gyna_25__1232@NODE_1614_length_1688_cov_407_057004_g1320_i0_p1_GENE_NODE_1614_length_1688_cov_407_057004_g1320_i0NODE_1614_length_1688_cov_407_057004_g1320_i0_p1_ORF_typecomplete_len476_score83_51Herpes_TK_C/PF08465_10/57Herpes_TK_C/PF08465_10/84Herpes_TK_C/PF08465_10/57SKA2/PF16740_5/8_7e03SKA2/PF16740_5/1_7e02SKA2/PF16740_5/1_1e03SKA2/PF16740_5/18_NODE_1614_length_1688_cov_407_057004_g1320_i02051632